MRRTGPGIRTPQAPDRQHEPQRFLQDVRGPGNQRTQARLHRLGPPPALRRCAVERIDRWLFRLRRRQELPLRGSCPGQRRHRSVQQPRAHGGRTPGASGRGHRRPGPLDPRRREPWRVSGDQRNQHGLTHDGRGSRPAAGCGPGAPGTSGVGACETDGGCDPAGPVAGRSRGLPLDQQRRAGSAAGAVRAGQGVGAHRHPEPGRGGRLDRRRCGCRAAGGRVHLPGHRGARGRQPSRPGDDLGRTPGGHHRQHGLERSGPVAGPGRRLRRGSVRRAFFRVPGGQRGMDHPEESAAGQVPGEDRGAAGLHRASPGGAGVDGDPGSVHPEPDDRHRPNHSGGGGGAGAEPDGHGGPVRGGREPAAPGLPGHGGGLRVRADPDPLHGGVSRGRDLGRSVG